MSYDLGLRDAITGEWLELDERHQMKGGTYQLGGCPTAELNVTYNYARHFERVFEPRPSDHPYAKRDDGKLHGIRSLYGLTGAESIERLQRAIDSLGDDVVDDYWKSTEGNAKRALQQLLALARMRPDGVWDGD